MTANQTIYGVPRELRPLLAMILNALDRDAADGKSARGEMASELRALLDVPAYPNRLCHIDYTAHPYICGCLKGDEEAQRRFDEHQGKSAKPQGKPVAILSGPDDSVCWTQDSKPRELRKQVVLIEHSDFLRLQALSSLAGEPVYQTRWNRLGEWEEWKTVSQDQYQRSEGRLFERRIVYAERPAPVAVPRLEMAHVVRAHMEIPGCPVLTSNQCHALAMKLNESLKPSL